MDSVCSLVFGAWLPPEQIKIALNTRREDFVYCQYKDFKHHGTQRSGMLNQVTREVFMIQSRTEAAVKMFFVAFPLVPIFTFSRLVCNCAQEIKNLPTAWIRTIWYSIGLEMAAILAFMMAPDQGKRFYSLIETRLNYDTPFKHGKNEPAFEVVGGKLILWSIECVHPLCRLDDQHDGQVRYEFIFQEKLQLPEYYPCPLLPCLC